jgi:hypothetical protein
MDYTLYAADFTVVIEVVIGILLPWLESSLAILHDRF